ncbi:RHS repeat domain-containing protein [Hoeflea poritis]|uniref:RHS repeat-associated core domain-containing protein n=1 Tax=Hoeflea poritis TaxID=2993659 RepID=A0ABT4VW14_9HYPH|nr:hypothetical protein [Hoeflea poritis]MDA4848905.1 hypothetical protein [Hoeflea poritis]
MDIKLVGTSPQFIHHDHLSSVRFVTDATGTLIEQTAYASYGEPTNAAMATQKGYINERHDPETGLMYLNARYMDPSFGRLSPPTTGTPSSMASDRTDMHMPQMIPSINQIQTGIPIFQVLSPRQ